ncbi:putative thiamine transporter SLC35F3a [Tachysurus ichikawai]
MWKSPAASPRRLSDISPQLRQLKSLAVEEEIKEDFKSSRSVEDIKNASIEERILRITGYYGYQPWSSNGPDCTPYNAAFDNCGYSSATETQNSSSVLSSNAVLRVRSVESSISASSISDAR